MKIIKQYIQTKKSKGRLPLRAYLAYLLVCTLLLTGITFSKYVTFSDATDSARVAKGIVTVKSTSDPVLRAEGTQGGNTFEIPVFNFEVSNKNSEVAITYDIVVTLVPSENTLGNTLPEGVFLMEKNGIINPTETETLDKGVKYIFSDAGTFEAGEPQTNSHVLGFMVYFIKFTDPGEFNYDIDISIESHQID